MLPQDLNLIRTIDELREHRTNSSAKSARQHWKLLVPTAVDVAAEKAPCISVKAIGRSKNCFVIAEQDLLNKLVMGHEQNS